VFIGRAAVALKRIAERREKVVGQGGRRTLGACFMFTRIDGGGGGGGFGGLGGEKKVIISTAPRKPGKAGVKIQGLFFTM